MNSILRYFHSLRPMHWAILAAVAISTFTVVFYHISYAACYPGSVLGRTCYKGYFSNIEDHGGDSVLPVISGGLAVPNNIDTADEFYTLLRNAYASSSAQRKTGAAFIYNTLMGRRAPGVGRTVTAAQWNELRVRLNGLDAAGKIRWTGNVSAAVNSFWQGTDEGYSPDGKHNDDTFYTNYKNETGITIRDYNNNVIYELLRRCANPIGDPREIPPALGYELTPRVTGVNPDQVEPGGKVSVGSVVNNTGDRASDPTQWEITQITVAPGKRAPHENENGTTSSTAPCQSNGGAASGNYFDSADADCKNVAKGSGVFNRGSPAQNLKPSASNLEVGDLPAGARICFALSVQPRSNTNSDWAHSKPICTVVGKKPKLQVWGGDVIARGDIETSTSVKEESGANKTYGSWVEYGIFAAGENRGLASGSALNNGSNDTVDSWNKITFANIDDDGTPEYGGYVLPTSTPLSSQFMNNASDGTPTGDVGTLNSGTYKTTNLTINGSTVGQAGNKGKSIVIIATGTVTITGNIQYQGSAGDTFTDPLQIPQLIIIANQINIAGSVERIDAWLLTTGETGYVNTCSDFAVTDPLTTTKCDKRLTVNGPVETAHLYLRRTAGSGTAGQSNDPAEVFNLRADAYIWARSRSIEASKAQTVFLTELPPRF